MIRVLLVDDSQIALTLLKRMLAVAGDISVVGTAFNGKEALDMIPAVEPDVICTDLHMPVMDGLEFIKEVMKRFPKPVLVTSVSVQENSKNVFALLEAGAVDVFQKPRGGTDQDYMALADGFQRRIRIVAGVHVFRRMKMAGAGLSALEVAVGGNITTRVVVIGASTGGPQVLQLLFSSLPPDFPVPILCVQHIERGFLGGLVEWLQLTSRLKIAVAADGEAPRPGYVYFAPEDRHLVIDGSGRLRCFGDDSVSGHCPSISVLFKSVARRSGRGVIGVLLTGMGNDGAEGMQAIADAGGVTIVQDEKTCAVFSMPQHAIELGAAEYVLSIDDIPSAIIKQATAIK